MPKRRHTLFGAAVLSVLVRTNDEVWSAVGVAEECGVAYGSAYAVLQRLHEDGLVSRIFFADGGAVGHTRVWYEPTPRGKRVAEQLLRSMPDPVTALRAWQIDDDT